MATWLTHLRIAEKIKNRIPAINLPYLMLGSIAPASGQPAENTNSNMPSKEITHFSIKQADENDKIDLKSFHDQYLLPEKILNRSDKTRSFLWGYYFHLIADTRWTEDYLLPQKLIFDAEQNDERCFLDVMKEEIYALDFLYLQQKGMDIIEKFKDVKGDINFFNEFESSYIYECQKKIVDYYEKEHYVLDRDFRFYTLEQIDKFIDEVSQSCIEVLL